MGPRNDFIVPLLKIKVIADPETSELPHRDLEMVRNNQSKQLQRYPYEITPHSRSDVLCEDNLLIPLSVVVYQSTEADPEPYK